MINKPPLILLFKNIKTINQNMIMIMNEILISIDVIDFFDHKPSNNR